MKRIRLQSGFAVALVFILGNMFRNKFGFSGIVFLVVSILFNMAAVFPAIYRLWIERKQRIIPAAMIAGIDIGAVAALLVCAYQFVVLYPIPTSVIAYVSLQIAMLAIMMLILGFFCSGVLGVFFSMVGTRSQEGNDGKIVPEQSVFEGRRFTSYIPIALSVLIIFAGITTGVLIKRSNNRNSMQGYNEQMKRLRDLQPKIGDPAPDVQMKTLDGRMWRLADNRGKVLLIDFWATWCQPCRESLPMIQRIHKKFGDKKDFQLVSVSLDKDRSELEKFIKTHNMNWTILYDNNKFGDNEFARKLGVFSIPSIWIIDKNGKIAAKGIRNEKQLTQKISQLLD